MRILHLAHCYPPAIGGSELMMGEVSERLVRDFGHEVTVVTTTGYSTAPFREPDAPRMAAAVEVRNGVEVHRHDVTSRAAQVLRRVHRPAWRLRVPGNSLVRGVFDGPVSTSMLRDALSVPADIVGATAFPLLQMHYAALAARRRHVPFVIVYGAIHPEDPWGYDRATVRRLARTADAYIASTPFEADYVRGLGARPGGVRVVPLGIDPAQLDHTAGDLRAEIDLPADARVFGFVGQLSQGKGVLDLIRAFAMVAQDLPDWWLLLAGGRTAEATLIERELTLLPASVTRRIRLLENFDATRKGDVYRALDVFVSPSHNESFGITTVEAWHVGRPVIATRLAAVESFATHNEDALLVRRGDRRELAGALREMALDAEWAQRLAAAGRERARALTWEQTARGVDEVYRELVT